MPRISVQLDKGEIKILEKRAKKNFLSLTEQVEDIIRRSCVSSAKSVGYRTIKVDDKLVAIFSRYKRGGKKKKSKKK